MNEFNANPADVVEMDVSPILHRVDYLDADGYFYKLATFATEQAARQHAEWVKEYSNITTTRIIAV